MAKVAELEAAEKDKMREKVQNIISHVINCFGNRQLTYNIPEEQFAEAGILVIEHADFDESVKLGHCKLIEEIMIDEDNLMYFPGTNWVRLYNCLERCKLVAQLRAEHHKEENNAGIDVITGQVGDMAELGISEAFKVKQAVLLSATEAAGLILRLMKSSHMPHGGGKTECKPGLDVLNLLRCLYSIMLKL
ncbi:hypothetical protein KY290_029186 [Solanum tuberosum]|uniref:Uncharacterized protein n=1 Tax=Solanum tuberosum TaxID=4113 RepID=A0ABQ7UK11_SOLTU|nr:hypothetical protein KY290_029186 [Solanum tuberosum]